MTVRNKVRQNEHIITLKQFLAHGMCTLIEAVRIVDEMFQRGELNFDESEEAVRQLARVKPPVR